MFELSIVVKATVVLALALIAARLACSARASVRHLLLAAAFGALAILPAAAVLLPRVELEIPIESSGSATPFIVDDIRGPMPQASVIIYDSSQEGRPWTLVPASTWFRVGWALGALLFLVPLASACWRLRRIRPGGRRWSKGDALVGRLAAGAGIRRPVDIRLHEDIAAPMTCGLVRPLIVMPADAREWSDADLERAIVHELEHVHRADWPVQLLARVVCSLYWFHPLAWMAWRRICVEAERACDDAVLLGSDRSAYAEQLVSLARWLVRRDVRPMLSMANRSDLSARVTAVLDVHQPRGRTGIRHTGMIVAVAIALVAALSPLDVVGQGAQGITTQPITQPPAIADGALAFEVASIKPVKAEDSPQFGYVGFLPGGRFQAKGVTLQELISGAYGSGNGRSLRPSEIIGGPRWITVDRFDIEAKAETNPQPGERSLQEIFSMVRTLLSDRFKLAAHYETRELPIYELVVAARDGGLGPQLRRAPVDCSGLSGNMPPPTVLGKPYGCVANGGPGRMQGRGLPLSFLASGRLPRLVDRQVIDRTGLTGAFEWDLEWTPVPGEAVPPKPEGWLEPPSDGPWIFTALQEQLGLKLESARGPVDVLVIDSVQQPTSDDVGLAIERPPSLVAQSPATSVANPTFEVASVKPNRSGEQAYRMEPQAGGRITVVNAPLRLLIRLAYRLQDFQIVDGPGWLNSDRFDIVAKAEGSPTQAQLFPMIRALLADRFKLRAHNETRELPIYTLVMARSDGNAGPRLRQAEPCFRTPDNASPQLPPLVGPSPCGFRLGPGTTSARGVTMAALASTLSNQVSRVVLDRTELKGEFDMNLEWMPDSSEGPAIFTAVQEQLGLKLEPARGPVDVLVIESVEQPTPD